MELTFLENDGKWIAEFKVDKEFNLHIEREDGTGKIKMYQNSATGGKYAIVEDFAINNNYKPVLDFSSGYFVGEKSIKIVSEVLPTYAAITTDGDVVEIKSQAKVVEITSNGTTSVEPDAGFSYLSKVDVKVDVPQSGGGDAPSEPSGGSNYEYLDLSGESNQIKENILKISLEAFFDSEKLGLKLLSAASYVAAMVYLSSDVNGIKASKIDFNTKFIAIGEVNINGTIMDALSTLGLTKEQVDAIPRITEEEFYNLES